MTLQMVPKPSLCTFDFDSLADGYDQWFKTPKGAMYSRLEKRVLGLYLSDLNKDSNKSKSLLEVGCGTGYWSHFFTELGFKVTGIDYSVKMIEAARHKNIPQARFLVADIHTLPFENGHFEATVAVTALEFVHDPKTAVAEMIRCTRPKGIIIIAALNALAHINQQRKALLKPPYHRAQFFMPDELECILAPYGQVEIHSAAFVLEKGCFRFLSPIFDLLAQRLQWHSGALLLGRVKLY